MIFWSTFNISKTDTEYYLQRIYQNQSEWLTNTKLMATESSIMDFEITKYAENLLKTISKDTDVPEKETFSR